MCKIKPWAGLNFPPDNMLDILQDTDLVLAGHFTLFQDFPPEQGAHPSPFNIVDPLRENA